MQAVDRTAEVGDFRIVLCEYDRCIHALCLLLKHRARFLAGYCSKRVAEKLSVVKRDVGNDAQHRRDYVCAVEPSAESNLDYGNVDFLMFKIFESHYCCKLEKRRLPSGVSAVEKLIYKRAHKLFGNHFAVHTYAFAEVEQVGRSVKSHPVARFLQDSRQ